MDKRLRVSETDRDSSDEFEFCSINTASSGCRRLSSERWGKINLKDFSDKSICVKFHKDVNSFPNGRTPIHKTIAESTWTDQGRELKELRVSRQQSQHTSSISQGRWRRTPAVCPYPTTHCSHSHSPWSPADTHTLHLVWLQEDTAAYSSQEAPM